MDQFLVTRNSLNYIPRGRIKNEGMQKLLRRASARKKTEGRREGRGTGGRRDDVKVSKAFFFLSENSRAILFSTLYTHSVKWVDGKKKASLFSLLFLFSTSSRLKKTDLQTNRQANTFRFFFLPTKKKKRKIDMHERLR